MGIAERIKSFPAAIPSFFKSRGAANISHYLDSRLVAFLEAETAIGAIHALVDVLDARGKLPNKEQFRRAVLERESLISTGIGLGVAVPHAKLKGFRRFFIAVGIQQKNGIDWDAADKVPVRLIFLIGGPEDRQHEYLQILSQLTAAVRNQDLRKELARASDPQEIIQALSKL